jgi:phosphatidylinositol alpha-1,6-mannosyltransferase
MWIGLFPELSEVGGIQQMSRHAGAVLTKLALEGNQRCELLGLNDPRGPASFRVGPDQFSFTGMGRDKLALFSHLLRAAPQLDILYLGHVNLSPLGLALRLVHPRIQYWVAVHGVEVWQPLPFLRRMGLRHARGVLSVSAFTAAHAVKAQKLDPARVFLLPPALDPSFTQDAGEDGALSIPPRSRLLLTVGRLISDEPGKGVDGVIRALPAVLKAVPNLFYVVVGGGSLQPQLEKLARESPTRDHILFIGKLRVEELKTYYSKADVFVMPSRQEGFGIVFLEAMAMGTPVIASNHGGVPEIVRDSVTGFLVDQDDIEGLTDRLILLLRDEALRKMIGEAGRKQVEENYSFTRFQQRLTQILAGSR